jgi:DNA excision repair protein ERCC-1
MSERRFNIPTVEQIEQHKRKSKVTNYFQQSKVLGSAEESASVISTPNEAIEIPPQLSSSAVASSTISETTTQSTTPPPPPATTVRRLGPNTILVNQAQRGNPILQHVRNVPWEYDDIKADYTVGQTTCVLYLR